MSISRYVYGQNINVGDGYNADYRKFSTFFREESLYTYSVRESTYFLNCTPVSDRRIIKYTAGEYLLEPVLKCMEFRIVNDDKQYHCVSLGIYSKAKTSGKIEKYPRKSPFYVSCLKYGVVLQILFEQNEDFPESAEMNSFLNSAFADVNTLSEAQKKTKCRVLINAKETRRMTLEQVVNFKSEYISGQHREHEELVVANLREKDQVDPVKMDKADQLYHSLAYLYTCYRKLELKLEAAGYPFLEDSGSEADVVEDLACAKAAFANMDKDIDFFKMYPILKNLFWSYRRYLEDAIERKLDLDEDLDSVEKCSDFVPFLVKLNEFYPSQIQGNWTSVKLPILYSPPGFKKIEYKLAVLLRGVYIENEGPAVDNLTEPRLTLLPQTSAQVFGFVAMDGAELVAEELEGAVTLNISCPAKCTSDKRTWLCEKCGNVVKIHQTSLVCVKCGVKFCAKALFTCVNPRHPEPQKTDSTDSEWESESCSTEDSSDEEDSDDSEKVAKLSLARLTIQDDLGDKVAVDGLAAAAVEDAPSEEGEESDEDFELVF